MHLFGKKKKEAPIDPHDAITKLKETESTLGKRRDVMEHKVNEVFLSVGACICVHVSSVHASYMHAYMHTCMHACMHTYIQACIHA